MQRKNLALRVLSTAAIMSIVTSIAAPAFADVYYIGNGSIDVTTITDKNGQYVQVKQGNNTYTDTSDEIVIKDGFDEESATQQEKKRIEGKRAEKAIPDKDRTDTQELETAGPAAGESQPDPDADFTLSEEEERGKDTTATPTENPAANPTENPKKDVVYQLDPVDPEPEQQATKPTLSVSDAPTAETKEATQADTPATTTPAEGSAGNPSKNIIRVVNDWVDRVLNIRLSNVNIKQTYDSIHADGTADGAKEDHRSGMTVKGSGNTKLELDGQNVLDGTGVDGSAGLYKDDGEGWLTITDETNDRGEKITSAKTDDSGILSAKTIGGNSGAAIGGISGKGTKNIIIEGYATVNASGGQDSAGIGGGGTTGLHKTGNAENIIIRGHSNVTATAHAGAAIGSGCSFVTSKPGCSATGIQIYGHATVNASTDSSGAAIGATNCGDAKAEVTIGTAGATAEQEDVHVTATSQNGAAIGNGRLDTKVIIQGNTTIENASSKYGAAIGGGFQPLTQGNSCGKVTIDIKDNAFIRKAEGASWKPESSAIGGAHAEKIVVNIGGNAHLGTILGGIGSGTSVKETTVNIGGNTKIDTINTTTATNKVAIGGWCEAGEKVTVNIDGGKNGNVELGNVGGINGMDAVISGTSINIGDHVLIKLKQKFWKNSSGDKQYSKYLSENNAEKELTSVSGVSDNTALWYTDYNNKLQKIVHGKNFCKKKIRSTTRMPTARKMAG